MRRRAGNSHLKKRQKAAPRSTMAKRRDKATVQTNGCNGRQRQWNRERSDDKFGPGLIGAHRLWRCLRQVDRFRSFLYHPKLIQMFFVAGRRRPVLFLHRYLRALSAFAAAKPLSASTLLCRQIYPSLLGVITDKILT
jgi:hypothetical protein